MLKGSGNWTQYRNLPNVMEVDFHSGRRPPEKEYWEVMEEVWEQGLDAIRGAHESGREWVLFTHGCSTSRCGATTARSVLRGLLRSRISTPYVIKAKSIQHESVLVVAIRRRPSPTPPPG